jgi:signal transduction histidine kinase
VNPAAKKTFKASGRIDRDDIVGKKISSIIGKDPQNALDNEMEFDGVRYDVSTFDLPDWRGRNNSICYILRNITDRVELEHKLETLHLYATRISNTENMEQIGEITANALSKSLGFDNGILCQFEDNDIKYVKLWGITSTEFNHVMKTEKILENLERITESQIYPSVDDFLIDVGYGLSKNFRNKTMALIPIIVEGKVTGVLALFQQKFRNFSNKDLNLMEIFGGHIASAISSLKQNEKLREIQAEEIKQILEGAGRVSSMVRHDLRGPLQTIRNAAYIVESNPEKIEKMVPIINKSIEYIVKILEDLQYQDQPSHFEKVHLNINTLIEQTLTQLIVPENIAIQQNLCKDPIDHMLDKIKIQRMLNNLFRNAFEAMTSGGILTISTEKCRYGTEIKVKDTGIGIKDTSKLFTPFHTTKINGMGLGLVSVKQTVEKHGGFIEVSSKKGKGTEFIIRIPEEPNHMGMRDTRLKKMITK